MGQGGKDKGLLLAFLYHFLWGAQPKDVQAVPQTVWRHMCEALRWSKADPTASVKALEAWNLKKSGSTLRWVQFPMPWYSEFWSDVWDRSTWLCFSSSSRPRSSTGSVECCRKSYQDTLHDLCPLQSTCLRLLKVLLLTWMESTWDLRNFRCQIS